MSWLAVKEFCKKTWKFVVDQWLFFVALVLGVVSFFLTSRGSKADEVLDVAKKAESEEREARKGAQERTEKAYEILNEKLNDLSEEERESAEEVIKENAEEFEEQVQENKDKPLDDIVDELASKYGLTKQ